MAYNWVTFVDHFFDDGLVLRTYVGEFGSGAEYIAGDGSVAVRVLPADDPASEPHLQSWSLAAELPSPHLIRTDRAARTKLDGLPVVYAVTEPIEDRLGELIPERPLTPDEAKDVVSSLAAALDHLHSNGIAHQDVKATSIIAAGGRVKLTADRLTRGGLLQDDMVGLGATIVEILTQRRPLSASDVPATLPSPYRQIAKGCLRSDNKQWDIKRVLAALAGRLEDPVVITQSATRVESGAAEPAAARAVSAKWFLVLAGVMIALSAVFLIRPRGVEAPVESPTQPQQTERQRAVIPAPQTQTPRPSPMSPPPKLPTPRTPAASKPAASGGWGVVAAAYRDFDDAERRAAALGKQSANIRPTVYPAKGQGRRYYVVLGMGLSRDTAERLLREARSAGLPRDSYVTRIGDR